MISTSDSCGVSNSDCISYLSPSDFPLFVWWSKSAITDACEAKPPCPSDDGPLNFQQQCSWHSMTRFFYSRFLIIRTQPYDQGRIKGYEQRGNVARHQQQCGASAIACPRLRLLTRWAGGFAHHRFITGSYVNPPARLFLWTAHHGQSIRLEPCEYPSA